jgi:hypothetical protein
MDEELEREQPKYVVFKMEDYHLGGDPLDDAVVIRLKDPFAATALYTYCNTIMSFLELMDSIDGLVSPDDYQRLLNIADYFHGMGVESEAIKGKRLPD